MGRRELVAPEDRYCEAPGKSHTSLGVREEPCSRRSRLLDVKFLKRSVGPVGEAMVTNKCGWAVIGGGWGKWERNKVGNIGRRCPCPSNKCRAVFNASW